MTKNVDSTCNEPMEGRKGHRFHKEGRRHKYILREARKKNNGKNGGWGWPCGHRSNPRPGN